MCVVHINYGKGFTSKQARGLLKIYVSQSPSGRKQGKTYAQGVKHCIKKVSETRLLTCVHQEMVFSGSSVNPTVSSPAGWVSAAFLWPDVLKLTKRDLAVIILCGAASDTRDTCCH